MPDKHFCQQRFCGLSGSRPGRSPRRLSPPKALVLGEPDEVVEGQQVRPQLVDPETSSTWRSPFIPDAGGSRRPRSSRDVGRVAEVHRAAPKFTCASRLNGITLDKQPRAGRNQFTLLRKRIHQSARGRVEVVGVVMRRVDARKVRRVAVAGGRAARLTHGECRRSQCGSQQLGEGMQRSIVTLPDEAARAAVGAVPLSLSCIATSFSPRSNIAPALACRKVGQIGRCYLSFEPAESYGATVRRRRGQMPGHTGSPRPVSMGELRHSWNRVLLLCRTSRRCSSRALPG